MTITAAIETGQLMGAKLGHEAKWVAEFDEFSRRRLVRQRRWDARIAARELRHGSRRVKCSGIPTPRNGPAIASSDCGGAPEHSQT